MAVLITGAEGFLGQYLANRLHAQGTGVVGMDVAAGGKRPWPVITGDITDPALVARLFADHDITGIIHCGGVSGPHICNSDPARVFHVNVFGTLNLFEEARKRKFRGRLVFVSSSSVYGKAAEKTSCVTPVAEDLALLASEPYGSSKVSCEALARAYIRQENIDAISCRVSIVYGAGRTAYCGITRMIKAAIAGEPIPLDNDCDVPLPWVYIDDLCDALLTALTVPKERFAGSGDILAYNVTGPGYPTFREMADVLQELVPGATVRHTGEPDQYAMNARKMSLTAIERDLGWKPKVDIADGVRRLYRAMTGSK